jgi:glutamyl-Q tRNA(Asp) synthetase
MGPDGRRFAKRDRSLTLRALREAGRTPAEVRAMAGFAE